MAYDEYQADRIRQELKDRSISFIEKKMMGGLCFMVDDKMLCGIHNDKQSGDSLFMARVGPDFYEKALEMEGVELMEFTGRPLKGYVYVTPEAIDQDAELDFWMEKCLEYNPKAKSSKKRNQ